VAARHILSSALLGLIFFYILYEIVLGLILNVENFGPFIGPICPDLPRISGCVIQILLVLF